MKKAIEYGSAGWQARCASIEDDSTRAFVEYCKAHGWAIRKASPKQDMFDHIDFFVSIGGMREIAVDVKGRKRFADEGFFLIEILNVSGGRGWLLGKADVIAFQTSAGWIFANRNNLYAIVKAKLGLYVSFGGGRVNVSTVGRRAFSLPCVAPDWYCRPERREMVTYLRGSEIPLAF